MLSNDTENQAPFSPLVITLTRRKHLFNTQNKNDLDLIEYIFHVISDDRQAYHRNLAVKVGHVEICQNLPVSPPKFGKNR